MKLEGQTTFAALHPLLGSAESIRQARDIVWGLKRLWFTAP